MGGPRTDAKKCNLDVGSYAEVFEDNGWMQNSNRTRDTPAMCLGHTPCRKPSNYFMSLVTGKRLHRRKWSEYPIPDWVIDRAHFIAQV